MRGDEAERARGLVVAAARDHDGAEPVERGHAARPVGVRQERVAGAAGPVGGEPALVRRGRLLRGGELRRGAAVAERVEERAVRILRAVLEVARELVEHDRGAALDDRERVAPEPQREPERDGRDRDRVQPLARRVMVLPRHPDHERIERLLEPGRAARDPAQERLGVRDRRRAREGGDRGELASEILEDAAAHPGGEEREPAQRRGDEVLERRVLVRIAPEAAQQPRRVEHERRADHGHARRERTLEREAELPAAGGGGLEQRVGGRRAQRRRAARAEQCAGPAVQDGLGRRDADDEIRLDEEPVDLQRRAPAVGEVDEIRRLDVVHLDTCRGTAAPRRGATSASSSRCPARRFRPPATRIVCCRDGTPSRSSSRDRRRERRPARVVLRSRQRQLGRLDDDRRRPAGRHERFERSAREREAERIADGHADVDDRLGRRRRPQHDASSGTLTTATREPEGIGIRGITECAGRAGGTSA